MRIKLATLYAKVSNRPIGYLSDCLTHGHVKDGWIEFTDDAWLWLTRRYRMLEPTREDLAENYTAATQQVAARGFMIVSEQIYKARRVDCDKCNITHCEACGGKPPRLYWKFARCPEAKWQ